VYKRQRLDGVVQKQGVAQLLATSRLPARVLGFAQLQSFLERGFLAFHHLGAASHFLHEISHQESAISARLMLGVEHPFTPPFN
jgi:hypothetical protein